MDPLKHIRSLLDKFYQGETSLAEERELTDFFRDGQVPEELMADRELFLAMERVDESIEIPEGLEQRAKADLERIQARTARVRRINFYSLSGLAAGLLIILSVYLGFLQPAQSNLDEYAIEDPEQAYLETVKALELVSSKWGQATGELENLDRVNDGFQKVQTIQKVNSGSRQIDLLGTIGRASQVQKN